MRALGCSGTTMTGFNETERYNTKLTMASLLQWWNEWEIQLMVFLSFMLQLFLFLTGCLRRQNINSLLRVSIWLAYVGADLVAVYALGLFSQYEEKYMLGKNSFGDTLPFLWVPFLLVHLGGQDSITAFSIEDNNLWLRHLLNLGIQGTLALYVLWKSIDRINSQVLIPAALVFVSGIIKYGERTWALMTGSRDGLGKSSMRSSKSKAEEESTRQRNRNHFYASWARASYALQTVLLARGLFVGRTMLQLGNGVQQKFENHFKTHGDVEEKLKIAVMELCMMFDLLYTKAMVLQRRIWCLYRCAAHISLVTAFVLFMQIEKRAHSHSRVNVAISYTLFIGAMLMESCSVATVIASPWTRAHLKEGSFLQRRLSSTSTSTSNASSSFFTAIRSNYYSIGQFNHIDFSISHASTPKVTCKVISALGLGRQWKNLRHLKRVEAQGIFEYIVRWFERSATDQFGQLQLGRRLNYTLCVPFEHALYRLHIYTDFHVSRHFDDPTSRSGHHDAADNNDLMLLKEQCEKLSNYMMYLKERHPAMLPISSAVEDGRLEPEAHPWKRSCGRRKILEEHARVLYNESEPDSACPFEPTPDLARSLGEIREMWTRLLVFSAGKCGGELHARQLGNGVELLTFVWLLMLHHGLGDAATEIKLLASDDPSLPELGSVVAAAGGNWGPRPEQPRYAFDFRRQHQDVRSGARLTSNNYGLSSEEVP